LTNPPLQAQFVSLNCQGPPKPQIICTTFVAKLELFICIYTLSIRYNLHPRALRWRETTRGVFSFGDPQSGHLKGILWVPRRIAESVHFSQAFDWVSISFWCWLWLLPLTFSMVSVTLLVFSILLILSGTLPFIIGVLVK
jgi:hypothetical protein